ncbi:putative helicase [Cystoisospora suis]|uniref:Putative helicase n=1 Tax=Cystoisospora suis TaxID=483139 RepID=A0A2C6KL28_9APIC|nr:putative helicase [Cystoisospora suis]
MKNPIFSLHARDGGGDKKARPGPSKRINESENEEEKRKQITPDLSTTEERRRGTRGGGEEEKGGGKDFPFGFSFEPYEVQKSFMDHVHAFLEEPSKRSRLLLAELPTGTGKTLAILSATLSS